MRADQVCALLDEIEAAGLTVIVDGGWAVDACLGHQTRPHGDLDLALPLSDLPALDGLLRAQGFETVPTEDAWACNYVLGHADGRRVDLHAYALTEGGANAGGVPYVAAHLEGAGRIAGRRVRCVPPHWLLTFHAGYPLDAQDLADIVHLVQRFGLAPLPEQRAAALRLGIDLDLAPATPDASQKPLKESPA